MQLELVYAVAKLIERRIARGDTTLSDVFSKMSPSCAVALAQLVPAVFTRALSSRISPEVKEAVIHRLGGINKSIWRHELVAGLVSCAETDQSIAPLIEDLDWQQVCAQVLHKLASDTSDEQQHAIWSLRVLQRAPAKLPQWKLEETIPRLLCQGSVHALIAACEVVTASLKDGRAIHEIHQADVLRSRVRAVLDRDFDNPELRTAFTSMVCLCPIDKVLTEDICTAARHLPKDRRCLEFQKFQKLPVAALMPLSQACLGEPASNRIRLLKIIGEVAFKHSDALAAMPSYPSLVAALIDIASRQEEDSREAELVLGCPGALPLLLQHLEDTPAPYRGLAAPLVVHLGREQDEQVRGELYQRLLALWRRGSAEQQEIVVAALEQQGEGLEPIIPDVWKVLDNPSSDPSMEAQALALLRRYLVARDWWKDEGAIDWLGNFRDRLIRYARYAPAVLQDAAFHEAIVLVNNVEDRSQVPEWLVRILVELLRGPQTNRYYEAMRALAEVRGEAKAVLWEALDHDPHRGIEGLLLGTPPPASLAALPAVLRAIGGNLGAQAAEGIRQLSACKDARGPLLGQLTRWASAVSDPSGVSLLADIVIRGNSEDLPDYVVDLLRKRQAELPPRLRLGVALYFGRQEDALSALSEVPPEELKLELLLPRDVEPKLDELLLLAVG